MKQLFLLSSLLLSLIGNAQNATNDSVTEDAPNVFLDCSYCDKEYVKQTVPYLNYVRDRKTCDVHILAVRQQTGAGGWEEQFEFIGYGRFAGMNDTLLVTIAPNSSSDEQRIQETKVIQAGTLRYAMQTPLADHFSVSFDTNVEPKEVEDPWRNWVFELGANAWFNGNDAYTSLNSWGYINADKITEDVRLSLSVDANYNESRSELSSGTFIGIQRSQSLNVKYVNSISDHWSWGTFGGSSSSIFNNFKFEYNVRGAIEYNLYPYSESAKRQFRMAYSFGPSQNFYNTTTIFNKDEEWLLSHRINLAYRVRQNWGNINLGLWGRQYFHNINRYRITTNASCSIRVLKGLNVRLSGNFSVIQDQLSLPKEGLSDEEILTRQGQQATNYKYWGSAGISYTFGSIYNGIVNARFVG